MIGDPRLDELRDQDPPDLWRAELLSLGLLAEPGEPDGRDWERRKAILAGFREMHTRFERKTELQHPIAFSVGTVPPAVWVAIIAMVLVLSVAWPLIHAVAVSALILGFFAIGGLGVAAWMERQRRLDLEDEEAAYRACVARVRALAWEVWRTGR